MEHQLSGVVAWQAVVPVVMAALMMIMAKWLSHFWGRAALERTVRVVSKLGPRRQ